MERKVVERNRKKSSFFLFSVCICILFVFAIQHHAKADEVHNKITMTVGETKDLYFAWNYYQLSPTKTWSVSNSCVKILSYSSDQRTCTVQAVSPGTTTVTYVYSWYDLGVTYDQYGNPIVAPIYPKVNTGYTEITVVQGSGQPSPTSSQVPGPTPTPPQNFTLPGVPQDSVEKHSITMKAGEERKISLLPFFGSSYIDGYHYEFFGGRDVYYKATAAFEFANLNIEALIPGKTAIGAVYRYGSTKYGVLYNITIIAAAPTPSPTPTPTPTPTPQPLSITGVISNKTSTIPGDAITWTAVTSGGSETKTYRFELYKDGIVIVGGTYGSASSYTYTPTEAGTYKVRTYVKDNIGTVTKDSADVIVKVPLTISSVTCSKTSAALGESATYTINATGGKAPLSYCFYVFKDGVAIHKGSYGTSKTYTYTFSSAGSYKVQGYVKDANNAKVSKYSAVINVTGPAKPVIASVTCSMTSAALGESATYTINATGGKAPLSYCFYVFKNGVAIHKGSYGTSKTYTYTFSSAGSYKVQGYVKDANNAKVSKYSAVINVTAPPPPVISSVTCSKTSAAAYDSATYTINAKGGKAPLSYCFYVFKNGLAIYKGSYGTSKTHTYTFSSAGSYKVQGYVKDANNAKVSKYSAVINVTAFAPLTITSVTCSKTRAAAYDSATYTINAKGGKAPLSYCFYVYKNGVAIYKGSYGTSKTYTYTFSSAGSYKVQGYVKDANNTKVSKYSTVINVTAP